jgi:hypothetical protein
MRYIFLLCLGALFGSSYFAHHPTNSLPAGNGQKSAAAHVQIPQKQPRPDDVSSIDGMIKAYYEVVSGPAGQPRDWGRDATLYIPGIRFVMIGKNKSGKTDSQSMSHQEFVDGGDASMVVKGFYEHEIHRITHRAGDVAHVLSTSEHTGSPNGPAQGRSIDSLDLYWDGSRWWIASATIWEVAPGDSLPSEFLPK